jgi:hypothetical protein
MAHMVFSLQWVVGWGQARRPVYPFVSIGQPSMLNSAKTRTNDWSRRVGQDDLSMAEFLVYGNLALIRGPVPPTLPGLPANATALPPSTARDTFRRRSGGESPRHAMHSVQSRPRA